MNFTYFIPHSYHSSKGVAAKTLPNYNTLTHTDDALDG